MCLAQSVARCLQWLHRGRARRAELQVCRGHHLLMVGRLAVLLSERQGRKQLSERKGGTLVLGRWPSDQRHAAPRRL